MSNETLLKKRLQKLIVNIVVVVINIIAMKREAVLHPCLAVQSLLPAFYCELLPVSAASCLPESRHSLASVSQNWIGGCGCTAGVNVT